MSPARRREPPRGAELRKRLLAGPARRFDLGEVDPRATFGHEKDAAAAMLAENQVRLDRLQEMLFASKGGALLVVLQGMDTSGKDGTVRHAMSAFDPLGCTVIGFGVPTPEELAHDYLWRIHRHTPGRGSITIFNRSHYEDVLVVRVHGLVPESVWRQRYEQINAFEQHLTETGTTIVKCFLHLSFDEQRERLQARVDDPEKRWKFKRGDLDERKRWDDYMAAYQDAVANCSTRAAPWYVIPADRKWFRNLAVSEILVDVLEGMGLEYPPGEEGVEGLVVE